MREYVVYLPKNTKNLKKMNELRSGYNKYINKYFICEKDDKNNDDTYRLKYTYSWLAMQIYSLDINSHYRKKILLKDIIDVDNMSEEEYNKILYFDTAKEAEALIDKYNAICVMMKLTNDNLEEGI